MARDLETIYNDLIASKETDSNLNTLLPLSDNWNGLFTFNNFKLLANTIIKSLSTSKVAIWRLTMQVVAFGIWTHEKLWDVAKSEMQSNLDNNIFGSLPWYRKVSKLFQYGDSLSLIDNNYYDYLVIDETKQIVTQAAGHIANGQIIVKVAKGSIGSLTKLAVAEKSSFETYINDKAPAGSQLVIISDDADIIELDIQVFCDRLILDSFGQKIGTTIKTAEDALENYLQSIPFDSYFRVIDMVDAIQGAEGVKNVIVNSVNTKSATGSTYTNVLSEVGQRYLSNAGYFTQATTSIITYNFE